MMSVVFLDSDKLISIRLSETENTLEKDKNSALLSHC